MFADNLICTRNGVKQTTHIWGKVIKIPKCLIRDAWLFFQGWDRQSEIKIQSESTKGKACSF